jgi:hypothetical protein
VTDLRLGFFTNVQDQGVIDEFIAVLFRDLMLALLNHTVGKLDDVTTVYTDHVIMMFTGRDLID